MKLNRRNLKKLRRLKVNQKREVLKEIAKANDLPDMYLDVIHFTDKQVEEAYEKVLNNVLEDIQNGSK